eukprot:6180458-Pleurochrysis_carterae.AAC.2
MADDADSTISLSGSSDAGLKLQILTEDLVPSSGASAVGLLTPRSSFLEGHTPEGDVLAECSTGLTHTVGSIDTWGTFLRSCARRWPLRSGGRQLQLAAPPGSSYISLLSCPISEDNAEQIRLDVERSGVDDLLIVVADDYNEAGHRAALRYDAKLPEENCSVRFHVRRLLHAWCARHATGYCQGMNFAAVVLLAVMQHRAVNTPGAKSGEAHIALGSHDEDCEQLIPGEEDAFWTFVALVELLLPPGFYAPPAMPGLQVNMSSATFSK